MELKQYVLRYRPKCIFFCWLLHIYHLKKKEQLEGLLSILDHCQDYQHIIVTGDLNSKSMDWGNKKSNANGILMEEYMHRNALLCINDGQPTRRLSDSVIDLFIVSPRVVPEVAVCETMTHESVRSDHIGVLLEVYPQTMQNNAIFEKFIVSKADYSLWRECTEERFKEWNNSGVRYKSVDEMAEAFMNIYTEM